MRKVILILLFLSFLLQGCTSNETLIFKGESEHWLTTITVKMEEKDKKDTKNKYLINTVVKPKNKLDLDYLKYSTSFNKDVLGNSASELIGNDFAFQESYGVNSIKGITINRSFEQLKKDVQYSQIIIVWGKGGNNDTETIIAYPVN